MVWLSPEGKKLLSIMENYIIIFAFLMFLCPASVADYLKTGAASYYSKPYVPSACFDFQNDGVFLASVNDELWAGGNICGQYYQVYCPYALNAGRQPPCSKIGDTTGALVLVVDRCNDCGGATMLLSKEIFQMIADLDVGRIQINYKKFQPSD